MWAPPTHVDPSMLVHDQYKAGLDHCWTRTTVDCNCASPHIQVQTYGPGICGSTEVRIIRIAPLAPPPDPYANHLRLETICTIAAMDTLRLHIGLTEEMMCADEIPSPFYRSIRASADATVKENMVGTVQRIFKTLKPDLRPSREQVTVEHSPFIDVLPFQTLRKNLILRRNEVDEDTVEEWEQLWDQMDFESTGWAKRVEETKPNVIVDGTILEINKVQKQVKELMEMVERLQRPSGS